MRRAIAEVRNLDELREIGRPVTVLELRSLPNEVKGRILTEMRARLAADAITLPSGERGYSSEMIERALNLAPGTWISGAKEAGLRIVNAETGEEL